MTEESSKRERTPLIYRHPHLYQAVMRLLHWGEFAQRYTAIADLVPDGCEVVELCCGDCYLYRKYLEAKGVGYLGLDNSPEFVGAAQRRGIAAETFDFFKNPVPEADVVIMQASLHIFTPSGDWAMPKLLNAARQKVIVAEPVRNLSTSTQPIIAAIGKRLTKPRANDDYSGFRFDAASFDAYLRKFPELETIIGEPRERERIGVLKGRATNKLPRNA